MPTKLSDRKRQEHEERALRTARSIAEVDRVMQQEDLSSRDLYITNVAPDPRQPRRFYPEDEHELLELAESIRRNGLLQPISVRPDPADPERYLIIVGERRWRASQIAGKTRIRAVVHLMDEYAVRAAQYAENNKRADVSDVSRARSLQAMYDEERRRGNGWAEVAAASGITRMHVSRLTSLLRLPEPVVEMIDRKLLASAHGYELVRIVSHLPDEEIVGLAQSCRKPRRGEAFRRSVESLREQVNEILAHVQRPTRARPSTPEEDGLSRPSLPVESPVREDGRPEDGGGATGSPAPAPGIPSDADSPSGANIPSDMGVPSDAAEEHPPLSLFEAAIRRTVSPDEAAAEAAIPGGVRPHVRQMLAEIHSGRLRAEELKVLRDALMQ